MKLSEKQAVFTLAISKLITYAYDNGYELTFGDAYRDARLHGVMGIKKGYGAANSCHKIRLAVDFNIFKNGVFLTGNKAIAAHTELHEHWSTLGGSDMILGDSNHYSLEHQAFI
jgi:hypothetical protein